MDVEDIDEGEVNTTHIGGFLDDGEDELNKSGEATISETLTSQSENGLAEPCVGMEFNSEIAAKNFYGDYAKHMGFITQVRHFSRSSGALGVREFFCASDGVKGRVNRNCRAMVRIECKSNGKWKVTKFVKEHNHSSSSSSKVHYLKPRRHFAGTTRPVIETYQGDVPSAVMYVSVDGSSVPPGSNIDVRTSHPVDTNLNNKNSGLVNYGPRRCKRTLGRDAQNLLDYFKKMQAENPGFYYAIQLDEENRMSNAFWSDSRSRASYSHFGDAVIFDTMYRVNQYNVPFAPFTGVNHHGQTILFACALLLDESETSFVWLLKTFIACMHDRAPVSISTDQDRAIEAAVLKVLPETRHYISWWHVLREGQVKMASVCQAHPNFQMELYNCINLTKTIEEFESSWNSILEKYDLHSNGWLQSVYNSRKQWVPVYFRDSFFAAIYPDQGLQSCFFKGYVDQQTTLPMFFRQYERALDKSFENEIESDFHTICTTPIPRTPSPMEKQAAGQYTRRIFSKFQEELVETFVYTANKIDDDGSTSTFRVAKFENDQKVYIVSLNVLEMNVNCSCQMFEYSGILCRHVLTVFTVTNILTLPCRYILKRWTRNAKSGAGSSEEPGRLDGSESLIMRYNLLCREAIRYVEEGAIAPETYDVALNALKEVGKKLAAAKKTVAKAPTMGPLGNVTKYDDQSPTSASDVIPLLWPQQDEISHCFNLNDNGIPARLVSDLNLPRTLPTSLHHHDGHSDSMEMLPCLKSMTWSMEHKSSTPANRVALIILKLQDYSKTPSRESDVKFHLSQTTLEPMLRSMAYISEQLLAPANRVAVINLKLQDTETSSGESDIKFQVSRDTLGAMLRSMAYIREQLSNAVESRPELSSKKQKT